MRCASTLGVDDVEASASEESADVWVLMIDTDHFEEVNDRYRHPVGADAALYEAKRAGRDTVRELTAAA